MRVILERCSVGVQAKPALVAVMYREITARHKLILSVSSVVTPTMRILLVH